MSDMLAVLLGAGGGAASKAIAALSAGKQDANGIQAQEGGTDPFMAVLFSRLNPVEAQALQIPAVDVAQTLEAVEPVAKTDAGADEAAPLPLKPLELALLNTQWPPGDAGVQAAQVALAMPVALAQSLVRQPGDEVNDAAPVGGDLLPGVPQDKDDRKPVSTKSPPAAMLVSPAMNAKAEAAEIAANGQGLPPGRVGAESPPQALQVRPDVPAAPVSATLSSSAPGSVLQGLAAQFQAGVTDGVGVVSGQTGQAMAAGIGHGLAAMADLQGRPAAAGVQLSIDAPVRSPMFPQELGERIVWLSTRQGQVADIALNPPHLGPLEVKLSLSGGEAGAQFFSPHPQVRDAIEAALPKLREMMAEAGVTLGQAQVRDEAFPRQESLAQGEARHGAGEGDADEQPLAAGGGRPGLLGLGQGFVDIFV